MYGSFQVKKNLFIFKELGYPLQTQVRVLMYDSKQCKIPRKKNNTMYIVGKKISIKEECIQEGRTSNVACLINHTLCARLAHEISEFHFNTVPVLLQSQTSDFTHLDFPLRWLCTFSHFLNLFPNCVQEDLQNCYGNRAQILVY